MTALSDLVRPGSLVALADGTGSPRTLTPELTALARRYGDLRLVTGWLPVADPGLDPGAFADARTVMPGWGLRRHVDAGALRVLPVRISAVPALLAGRLRPDLLVAALVRSPDGLRFSTEVAWMRGLVEAGVPVAATVSRSAPCADAGAPLPEAAITVVAETDDRPAEVAIPAPGPVETVHDPTRLAAAEPPLIAVNTALEIDPDGQVNVEGTATSAVGGIGGHPDYAMAGARCPGGLSVIALAAAHSGRPTLVERLSRPVTTAGHDVDVVVTEHGVADLRGRDRGERTRALRALWAGSGA